MRIFLVLAALVAASQALQLQSTFRNVFIRAGTQGNETQWEQDTLTLLCNNNDFRDPGLLIGNLSYDILCQAPRYQFQTRLRQFVPEKRRRYIAEVCEVQNVGAYANNPGVDQQNLGARRRLLWKDDPTGLPTHKRKLLFFGAFFGGMVGAAVFGAVCPRIGGGFQDVFCPGGTANADAVDAARIRTLQADIELIKVQQEWQNATLRNLEHQVEFNQNVSNTLKTVQGEIDNLFNQTTTLTQITNAMAATNDRKFGEIADNMEAVRDSIAAGIDFSIAIATRAEQFENATFRNFAEVTNSTQALANNVSINVKRLQTRDRELTRMLRRTQASMAKNVIKREVRRELNRQIALLRQQAANDGLTPFFHPGYPGVGPSVSTPTTRKTLVDQLLINFINQSATFQVHQYTLSYYCNVNVVLDQAYSGVAWQDIGEFLGPVNCTNRPGEIVDNCRCWIELQHAECRAASTGQSVAPIPLADFNWQQITSVSDRSAYTLTSEKCFDHTTPITAGEPWNGDKIDSLVRFHQFLSDICGVTLASPTLTSGTRKFQIFSLRIATVNINAPLVPSLTCLPDLDYIFESNTGEVSTIFAIYSYLMQSFQTLLDEQQVAETQIYGILPNFLTHETVPFQSLRDNRTYTCYRSSFVAISPDTRPSFEVLSRNVVPLVTATAYDRPPICDLTGCVFGNPVSTESTSTAQTSVNFENLLPSASRPIMGEWRTGGIPAMTTIFDICDQCAPIDTVVSQRNGKITYVWQPIPDNYSISTQTSFQESIPLDSGGPWPRATFLDKWQEENPNPFNHFDGQFSLDLTEAPLSGGRCVLQPEDPVGWPCELLDQWSIHASTNMRQGLLVLTPKTWSYIVTLNVVKGEILQRVFAGCPEFKFIPYSDGFMELQLINSLPIPVRVVTRVTAVGSGCSPEGDITHTLEPRQVQQRIIIGCGQQLLSVFTIGAGGALQQCENTLNVTFVPNAQANVKRFVIDRVNRSFVTDEIVARSIDLQTQTVLLMQNLVPLLVTQFTPNIEAPERSDLIQQLLRDYNASLQTVRNTATIFTTGGTVTDAIQPFVQQFNNLSSSFVVLQTTAKEQIRAVEIAANVTAQDLIAFRALTAKLNAAGDAKIAADENEINAINNRGKQTGECNWCGDKLPGLLADILCPLICSIVKFMMGLLQIVLIAAIFYLIIFKCFPAIFSAAANRAAASSAAKAAPPPVQYAQPAPVQYVQQQPVQYVQAPAPVQMVPVAMPTSAAINGAYNTHSSDSEQEPLLEQQHGRSKGAAPTLRP